MKLEKGAKFKVKGETYKISSISKKRDKVFIYSIKYKVMFDLPVKTMEVYLEGK